MKKVCISLFCCFGFLVALNAGATASAGGGRQLLEQEAPPARSTTLDQLQAVVQQVYREEAGTENQEEKRAIFLKGITQLKNLMQTPGAPEVFEGYDVLRIHYAKAFYPDMPRYDPKMGCLPLDRHKLTNFNKGVGLIFHLYKEINERSFKLPAEPLTINTLVEALESGIADYTYDSIGNFLSNTPAPLNRTAEDFVQMAGRINALDVCPMSDAFWNLYLDSKQKGKSLRRFRSDDKNDKEDVYSQRILNVADFRLKLATVVYNAGFPHGSKVLYESAEPEMPEQVRPIIRQIDRQNYVPSPQDAALAHTLEKNMAQDLQTPFVDLMLRFFPQNPWDEVLAAADTDEPGAVF